MLSDNDLELVNRYRGTGETLAFERLFARHEKWVHGVCKRFLGSADAARDATQEVFKRCLENLDTFRGTNLPGWIRAIAVNCCLNMIESEKKWSPLDPVDVPHSAAPPADTEMIRAEQSARARQLIDRLPEKQRIVFCMKYIDGCSYEEIQELTGFSFREVKSYIQNARRNFENWWKTEEGRHSWKRS